MDVAESRVSLAALDSADVSSIKSALRRESFLRVTLLLSQLANSFAEPHQDVAIRTHVRNVILLRPMSPRVISIIMQLRSSRST
jgi:uncharacterized protein (DUF58 family)